VTLDGATEYLEKTVAFRASDQQGMVCGWVYVTDLSTAPSMFSVAVSTTNNDYFVTGVDQNGKLYHTTRIGGVSNRVESVATLSLSTWYHICVSSNSSRFLLWLNGATTAHTLGAGVDAGQWIGDIATPDRLTIGRLSRLSVITYFEGTIFDVRYYSREPTSAEISDVYDQGQRIVALKTSSLHSGLTLDVPAKSTYAQSSTRVSDRTPSRNHMDSSGSPTIAATGTTMNGSSQYLRAAAPGFGSSDSAGTVACWGTPSGSGGGTVFAVADEGSTSEYIYMRLFTAGVLQFSQQSGAGINSITTDSAVWSDGNPGFWAVTSNGSRWLMYSGDGLEAHSVLSGADNGNWAGDVTGADSVVFGALIRSSGAALYLSAEHQGCAYYKRELSAAELADLNVIWGP
jgi:hypothetical protein